MLLLFNILCSLLPFLITIYLLRLFASRQLRLRKLAWIPGPPALPILGNYFDLIATSPEVAFENLKKYNKKYGNIYKIWIGSTPVIHCQDIDVLKDTFKNNDCTSRPDMYIMLRHFLGDGLLFGEAGSKWKAMRKLQSGSFHRIVLNKHLKTLKETIDSMFSLLANKSSDNDTPVELLSCLKPWFLNISLNSTVGVEMKSIYGPKPSQYLDAIDRMSDIVMARLFSPLMKINFLFNLSSHKKNEGIAKRSIDQFVTKYVSERNANYINLKDAGKPRIVADVMLQLEHENRAVTSKDVQDQISNHVFAGYDTLTTAVSYLLFLLGNNMEIQDEVLKEIDNVVPNILTEGINIEQASNLTLLGRCLKESLRMFPPTALIGRRVIKPIETSKGIIPAGVDLYVNMYNFHRNNERYLEPDTFNPDRFLPENKNNVQPLLWIPFGIGPRSCIGEKQAMVQIKVITAMVVKKFVVKAYEQPNDLVLSANIMLKSKNGIRVYFSSRDS